jgi:hypothetical protein
MRIRVCYLDCHDAGLCCYLVVQKTYYIHYSYFISICDPFTDSSSQIVNYFRIYLKHVAYF